MKKIFSSFFLFMFFCSVTLTAQESKAILIFKDSTKKEGLATLTSSNTIKFRKTKKEKKQKFTFNEVDTLKTTFLKPTTYVAVNVKGKAEPIPLELVSTGEKAHFYQKNSFGSTPMVSGGGQFGGTSPIAGVSYSISDLYIKRIGEKEAVHLGSDRLFTKNFKKAASKFFEDCPELVRKIENEELKKRDLETIIQYYNEDCNQTQ